MKAILATAPGSTEVLQLRDIPKPDIPSPSHLRVKLAAAGVNPIDTKLRAKPVYFPDKLPAILGCDGAGIVEAIGSAVSRFKIGDQVRSGSACLDRISHFLSGNLAVNTYAAFCMAGRLSQ